jgi:hypothetical protein
MKVIGRNAQLVAIKEILDHSKSSMVAVTGRRRVGKTFLIDQSLKSHMSFRMTGIQNGSMNEQLVNFNEKLKEYSGAPFLSTPSNWLEAFSTLKRFLDSLPASDKKVLFFDEVPWIHTARSGFLEKLAHLWNDHLSKEENYIVVLCGSATSWINKNVIMAKGGLHNRITQVLKVEPFTLSESGLFLKSRGIRLSDQDLSKIYMAMGGVPYYLEHIKKGESAAVAIERLCFESHGLLRSEYNYLYKALFSNAQDHESIVGVLAQSQGGISREEIIKRSGVQSGGPYNRAMDDLIISGFVSEENLYGRKKRGSLYRLTDEYSIFYHRFIKNNKKYIKGMWQQMASSQSYKIWTGYAFESICFKHIDALKSAMGIGAVYTEISSMRVIGNKNRKGFQVDLIIDRKDDTINLCEVKYYSGPYTITKAYAKQLVERRQQFIEHTGTRKQVFITFITNYGLNENEYSREVVDLHVELSEILEQI